MTRILVAHAGLAALAAVTIATPSQAQVSRQTVQIPIQCSPDAKHFEGTLAGYVLMMQGPVYPGQALFQMYRKPEGPYAIIMRSKQEDTIVSCLVLEGPALAVPGKES